MHSQALKEFVQEQERQGNLVLIPKLNEKVLAVKSAFSDVVTFYTVDRLEKIRKMALRKIGTFLKPKEIVVDEKSFKIALNETQNTTETSLAQSKSLTKRDGCKDSITKIEISPQGRAIVALVDSYLMLRVVPTT